MSTQQIDTLAMHDAYERRVARVVDTLKADAALTAARVETFATLAECDSSRPHILEGCRRWLAAAKRAANAHTPEDY